VGVAAPVPIAIHSTKSSFPFCGGSAFVVEMPTKTSKAKYKRILLKLSGEALRSPNSQETIAPEIVQRLAQDVLSIYELGVQIGIVIGGGNIWRGLTASHRGMERTTADYMGMLATVINGLAIQSTLEELGIPTRVQTAIRMDMVAEPFIRRKAVRHLEQGRVVIFVAGTGNPFFSTDTGAALRANEIGAEVVLKATKVDGIYTADPKKDPKATKIQKLTHGEALAKHYGVMDATAFSLCQENRMPIIVFDVFEKGALRDVVLGKNVGTHVVPE
jgi:uridylate kinase